jgi:23S rRNA (pseudouridine1915-N3)-methyltransferase
MKISLLVVGKTVDKSLIALSEEYQNRLKHYISFTMQVIPELKNTKHLSENEQKEREADLILKQIDATDELILLDERGKQYTSVAFADFLEQKLLQSTKRIIFVVGGAYGFSERVYKRATGKMSLSSMTFSHQMVRVIFLEQLYRAMTIIKGEPYHHS